MATGNALYTPALASDQIQAAQPFAVITRERLGSVILRLLGAEAFGALAVS